MPVYVYLYACMIAYMSLRLSRIIHGRDKLYNCDCRWKARELKISSRRILWGFLRITIDTLIVEISRVFLTSFFLKHVRVRPLWRSNCCEQLWRFQPPIFHRRSPVHKRCVFRVTYDAWLLCLSAGNQKHDISYTIRVWCSVIRDRIWWKKSTIFRPIYF